MENDFKWIEWINKTFGLDNSVTIPTIISIIVFLVGGTASYIFLKIGQYQKRKVLRDSFRLLLREVIKDLKRKEKNTEVFYPQLTPEHTSSWFLPHKSISYLDTFFELDFNEVYYAFRKKLFWHFCTRGLREKSFHRVWGVLRDLRFLEKELEKHVDGLTQRFGIYHTAYGERLDEYRKYHDELVTETQGMQIPPEQADVYDYLQAQDKIWYDWQQIAEEERTFYNVTYTNLVQPILQLNREYPNIKYAQDSNNLLLSCVHQYIEIENTLRVYQRTFKNYYWSYRHAHRILDTCILVLR